MPTIHIKEDDNTIIAQTALPTGGQLCRIFNFAAGEVTTIFSQAAEKEEIQYGYGLSVSTALTSQMTTKNFSDFDDTREIEAMHKMLKEQLDGNPPDLKESLTGFIVKPDPSLKNIL